MTTDHRLSFGDYLRIPAINWSTLKHMAVSPLHYRHALDADPAPETDAMRFGSAVHCAILEPAEYLRRYVVWSGGTRRGKEWDAFEAAAGADGKTVLRDSEHDRVHELAEAVRSNQAAAPYLSGRSRQYERSIRWTDPETGLPCKGRLDLLLTADDGRRLLVDIKTARDIDARVFGQQAARLGYHSQLAFYTDGLAAMGEPVDEVAIIAAESAAPHDVAVYVLTDDVLHAGREVCRDLLRRLTVCRERNEWPGRYTGPQELQLPAWIYSDEGSASGFGLDLGGLGDVG